jgi:pantoate--beta-alanine ligase
VAARAFIGLGSDRPDALERMRSGLARLAAVGIRVADVSRVVSGPFVRPDGAVDPRRPPVANAVAEVRAPCSADALLRILLDVERAEGRNRDLAAGETNRRALDLDLLDFEGERRAEAYLTLPHPRAALRAFVMGPWEEVAPLHVPAGGTASVVQRTCALRAERPDDFARLAPVAHVDLPDAASHVVLLPDRAALDAWRRRCSGRVAVVMTMGALHRGHEALVRRAAAECENVLVTIFVNPLQFGPTEDLARYPRTLEEDRALLARAGAGAVYVPATGDLYPDGFATAIVPFDESGPAHGMEGAARPGHFRGVATVVAKLWLRTRPDDAWFGRKDAQQVAVVRRLVADLDLEGAVRVAPTVRDVDGLALSSRNRYLDAAARERAGLLPETLAWMVAQAAGGERDGERLAREGRARMERGGLSVDYAGLVNADTMEAADVGDRPMLAVAAVRVGERRLLDNRWLAGPAA